MAEQKQGEDRMRTLLEEKEETLFLAGFAAWLGVQDAAAIPAVHQSLTIGFSDGSLPSRHRNQALELVEQRWFDLQPIGLLESCAAGHVSIPLGLQARALDILLKKDLEAALKLYHRLPLNEDFGGRCDFYRRLSAIDPARAVRFYFETNERERPFNNPLEISFEAWAKRDFNAAWAAANAVANEDLRRDCVHILVRFTTKLGIDKACDLILKIDDPLTRARTADSLIYSSSIQRDQAIEIARRINIPRVWESLNYPLRETKPDEAVRILLDVLPEDQRVPVLSSFLLQRCNYKPTAENINPLLALIPQEDLRQAVRGQIWESRDEKEKLALEPLKEQQLEDLLIGGAAAYRLIQDGNKADAVKDAMFKRFPERSLPWVMQFDSRYRDAMLRDLSSCWPTDKVPADVERFLASKEEVEREFGIWLGKRWLGMDTEKAIMVLFSRYPEFYRAFGPSIPFYKDTEENPWDAARIGRMMDDIEDPAGRAIVYQEWMAWRVSGLPFDRAVKEISAFPHEQTRARAISSLVYRDMMKPTPGFIDRIIALPIEYNLVRDGILMEYIGESVEESKYDTGRTYDMIAAIRDEGNRLKIMDDCARSNSLRGHYEPLCGLLASMTSGTARDKMLDRFLRELPHSRRLGLARHSEHPLLRRLILEMLVDHPLKEADMTEFDAALAALPADFKDPLLENRWLIRKALADPAGNWHKLLDRSLTDSSLMERLPEIYAAWLKKDEAAAHRALMAMGNKPAFSSFYQKHITAAAKRNPQSVVGWILTNPDVPQSRLNEFLCALHESDPRAACVACLHVPDAAHRLDLLQLLASLWSSKDAASALAWADGLPAGPEHNAAVVSILRKNRDAFEVDSIMPIYLNLPPEEQKKIAPYLPNKIRELLPKKSDKNNEQARAAIRALAEFDFDTVSAKTFAMPAGEGRSLALLGMLDHALHHKKQDLTDTLANELLGSTEASVAEAAAITLINALDPTQLEKAIALANRIGSQQARVTTAHHIMDRWQAAEHRPGIEQWIRTWPDARARYSLASAYLTDLARKNPEALHEPVRRALQTAPAVIARTDLAAALLDQRAKDVRAAAEQIDNPDIRAAVDAWLESIPPEQD